MRKVAARDARGEVAPAAAASRGGRTLVSTLSEQPRDDRACHAVVIHEQYVHLVGRGARHGRPTSLADVTPPTRFPASRRTTRRRPSRAPACPAPSPASSREPTERASVLAPSRPRRASQYGAPDAKTSFNSLTRTFGRRASEAYPADRREKRTSGDTSLGFFVSVGRLK